MVIISFSVVKKHIGAIVCAHVGAIVFYVQLSHTCWMMSVIVPCDYLCSYPSLGAIDSLDPI